MTKPRLCARGNGCFAIEGSLSRDHIAALWHRGQQDWAGLARVELDLSAVDQCDSAGLALLVDWLRIATLNGQQLVLVHMSDQMAALARLAELESLFSP